MMTTDSNTKVAHGLRPYFAHLLGLVLHEINTPAYQSSQLLSFFRSV